jgi:hypothetical protein
MLTTTKPLPLPTAKRPSPAPLGADPRADADLDWIAFRARYFPGRRPRHDFPAVVAYSATKQAGESDG